MMLARQSVISWLAPIGMQLWLSAVATAMLSERRTPETPPSVTPPAICAGTARDDESPPTRKPSSSSARSATISAVRWLRGSAVNDAEPGGRAGDPGAVVAAELAEVVADGLEDPIGLLVQIRDHDRSGGLVEILLARGADPDADGADPFVEAGRALELGEHGRQPIADGVGDVNEAEPLRGQRRAELCETGLDGGFAGRPCGVGMVKSRHSLRPGAMM